MLRVHMKKNTLGVNILIYKSKFAPCQSRCKFTPGCKFEYMYIYICIYVIAGGKVKQKCLWNRCLHLTSQMCRSKRSKCYFLMTSVLNCIFESQTMYIVTGDEKEKHPTKCLYFFTFQTEFLYYEDAIFVICWNGFVLKVTFSALELNARGLRAMQTVA